MRSACFSCRNSADPDAPVRERVLRTAHWRAAHDFSTALPGWLVLVPLRHVTALDELTADEAAELGPLLARLTGALREVVGCAKTYTMLFAEKEGFAHLHFHVVPRAPDLPEDLRGPGILALLGADEAHRVPDDEQDRLALDLQRALG